MNVSLATMLSRRVCHLAAVALAMSALPCAAANFTWNGNGTDNNWSTGANWIGGTAPTGMGAGDTLFFGSGTNRPTTINTVNEFRISSTSGAALRFTSEVDYVLSGSSIVLAGNVSQSASSSVAIDTAIKMAGSRTFTLSNGSGTIAASGVISEQGGMAGLIKQGTGTLILNGNNTYTGTTAVNAGLLVVNGTNAATAVSVTNGATLRGVGRVGNVLVEGMVQSGTNGSSGILSTGSLTLTDTAESKFTISGTTQGTTYTAIRSTGNVDFGLSTLVLSLPSNTKLPNHSSYILFEATSYSSNVENIPNVSYLGESLIFEAIGDRWEAYNANIEQLVTFNPSNGTLTVVPEPSSIVLATMAGGVAGVVGIRRRRNAQSKVANG
jgi:autotransporter-associated beta strand protein